MLSVKPAGWNKPFHLYSYNKPKPNPLVPIRPIKFRVVPSIPVHLNHATKLRRRNTETAHLERQKTEPTYRQLTTITMPRAIRTPSILPKHTKTYQYRFKLGRAMPVIPRRFAEHTMKFKKPPFRHARKDEYGRFKIHNKEVLIGKLKQEVAPERK